MHTPALLALALAVLTLGASCKKEPKEETVSPAAEAAEPPAASKDAEAAYRRGVQAWFGGELEAGIAAYEEALRLDPGHYMARASLAKALHASGQHEAVAALLEGEFHGPSAWRGEAELAKLASRSAVCDADGFVTDADAILAQKDVVFRDHFEQQLAFMRPFAGKGALCTVTGDRGETDLAVAMSLGFRHSKVTVGGQRGPAIWLETRETAVVDAALVKRLGWTQLGTHRPVGARQDVPLVLIPSIEVGSLTLRNVPAEVQPLDGYGKAMGGTPPPVILGRQAMHALGAIEFDFPARRVTAYARRPEASNDAVALPLLMLHSALMNAPAIPVGIDGSSHRFFALLGHTYGGSLAITKDAYLASGHEASEVEPPDDPAAGLRAVRLASYALGDRSFPATATLFEDFNALVLTNDPPDALLRRVSFDTNFVLGGTVNLALMRSWRITYAFGEGKVYVEPTGRSSGGPRGERVILPGGHVGSAKGVILPGGHVGGRVILPGAESDPARVILPGGHVGSERQGRR